MVLTGISNRCNNVNCSVLIGHLYEIKCIWFQTNIFQQSVIVKEINRKTTNVQTEGHTVTLAR